MRAGSREVDHSDHSGIFCARLCDATRRFDVDIFEIRALLEILARSQQVDDDVGVLHSPSNHVFVVEIHVWDDEVLARGLADFKLFDVVIELVFVALGKN